MKCRSKHYLQPMIYMYNVQLTSTAPFYGFLFCSREQSNNIGLPLLFSLFRKVFQII